MADAVKAGLSLIDAAADLREREKALAHMPEILQGTAAVRCGTCRFFSGGGGVKGSAGMGICRRYQGSLRMYASSWEACWHHQLAASVARAAEDGRDG